MVSNKSPQPSTIFSLLLGKLSQPRRLLLGQLEERPPPFAKCRFHLLLRLGIGLAKDNLFEWGGLVVKWPTEGAFRKVMSLGLGAGGGYASCENQEYHSVGNFYQINLKYLQIGIGIGKFSTISSEEFHIGNFGGGDGSLNGDRNRYW